MPEQNRRTFMKRAGVVGLGGAVGGGIATNRMQTGSGPARVATADEHLPPLRGPYADEDWVEERGGPGNAKAIDEAPAVDPDDPDCAHFYDHDRNGSAVVDDTMYLIDAQGRIVAIDARDATERWTSDELGVTGTPTLAYHRIIAKGDGRLVALDVEDRSVDWEREFDSGPSAFVAAYETVYVIAEETLYALNVEDGSVRWTRDDEKYHNGVAAGNGEVYATPTSREHGEDYHDVVALDPMTGEDRWIVDRDQHSGFDFWDPIAGDGAVSVGVANDERWVFDAETREKIGDSWGFSWAMDNESIVAVDNYTLRVSLYREGESWDFSAGQIGRISDPAVAGDTVYVYYGEDETSDDEYADYEYSLLAFDKHLGEVKWTCEVQESDADDASIWFDIVATSDAVYVFGDEEIHVVRADDSTGGDEPTPTEEEPTPTDAEPTPTDERPTPTDAEPTPTDEGPTPTATEGESCPCDGTPDDGTPTRTTTTATPTEDDGGSAPVVTSTEDTDTSDGDGPGLGVTSALASLGGLGYLLSRRLAGDETDGDGRDP